MASKVNDIYSVGALGRTRCDWLGSLVESLRRAIQLRAGRENFSFVSNFQLSVGLRLDHWSNSKL